MRLFRGAALALCALFVAAPDAQAPKQGATKTAQECGSVVIIKCDKPEPTATDPKREAAKRMEARWGARSVVELDRVIIEGDAEHPDTPERAISRALSRPLIARGEYSFSIGESAQCTCMNICPPAPFPCCDCTDRVGSSLANAPGWKPTR